MIDINLLPSNLRKQGGLSSVSIDMPSEITLGLGGSFIIILILINVTLGILCGYQGLVVASKKMEWQKLEPVRKSIDELNKESNDIRNKVNSITKATASKHVGWSRRLNVLSDSIVKGMWFKKLTVDSKSLVIEGYAVSKVQSDLTTVNTFVSNLKKDAGFMAEFSAIEVNNVVKEKRGMVDISKFTIIVKMK